VTRETDREGATTRGEVVTRLGRALAFRRWQSIVNAVRGLRRGPIVMYHSFSPGGWRFINPETFRRHLEIVAGSYEVVGLPQLVDELAAGADTGRHVALTVDDAYEDFFTVAYPILREMRLPATVFVPTAYVGRHNDWEDRPHVTLPVMSAAQLLELDPTLITIGSHSVEHRAMSGLEASALEREVRESKAALERLVRRPVTLFAYPFGELWTYTGRTRQALRRAGYRAAVSTRTGTYGSRRELFDLRRIEFGAFDTADEILARLAGDWDWRAGRELVTYALTSR